MQRKQPDDNEINPFNTQWLSDNFGLKLDEVVNAKFDLINVMYEIRFKDLTSAQAFYQKMGETGCHPQIFRSLNMVSLNKYTKDKILKAKGLFNNQGNEAKQDSNDTLPNVQSHLSPLTSVNVYTGGIENTLFAKESLSLPIAPKVDLTGEKIIGIPFNLQWLEKYLSLDIKHVTKSEFDFNFMRYEITFDTLENAKSFHSILKIVGAHPELWPFNKALQIPYSNQFEILRYAEQSKIGLNPWNLDFFATYFDLPKEQVENDQYGSLISSYTIKFHDPHDAYNYYKKLLQNGIYPKNPTSDGELTIGGLNVELLLKGAAKSLRQTQNQNSKNVLGL